MDNKPRQPLRITIALLLAATGIATLVEIIIGFEVSWRFSELPTGSQLAFILWRVVLVGATGAYVWLAFWVLRGGPPSAPIDFNDMSSFFRLSVNCLFAVFLALGAMNVLLNLYGHVTYLWTGGGIPGLLISKGWGSTFTFFVYDTLRFCLVSFVAIWPVTALKPQKPVLYSLAIMIVMIILFQYWRHLYVWATLPPRALWAPWLVLIHVLSVPAMYQLHLKLKAPYNKSLNAEIGFADSR